MVAFLRRHPHKHDGIAHFTAAAKAVGNVVFSLFVPELIQRNVFLFGQGLHGFAKLLRDLPPYHRRRNRFSQLIAHKEHQPGSGRQLADVAIQVQTVHAFHFQGDMAVEQLRDGRHSTNSTRMPGFPLVGLRSKTSLAVRNRSKGAARPISSIGAETGRSGTMTNSELFFWRFRLGNSKRRVRFSHSTTTSTECACTLNSPRGGKLLGGSWRMSTRHLLARCFRPMSESPTIRPLSDPGASATRALGVTLGAKRRRPRTRAR